MARYEWIGGLAKGVVRGALCAATVAVTAIASPAVAAPAVADCPAARTPYSSDTLLIDLQLDPRTKAVLDEQGVLKGLALPPAMFRSTPPSMSAILTPRWLLITAPKYFGKLFGGTTAARPEMVVALDRALAAIPVTDAAAVARCARYDQTPPVLPAPDRHPAILVFEKVTGFRDELSIKAAHKAFADMGARRGWSVTFTDNAAVFNSAQLKTYDAIVWNNISGDALTVPQENAFKHYLAAGGGFAGVHGSGGDFVYIWNWYPDTLIGARFIGHPMNPQFQSATVVVEGAKTGIVAHLPDRWSMTEEWYSFASSPRLNGAHVLAHLDESTYNPGPISMGDHPIAWTRCIGNGRAFYTAIGHRPESYAEPNSLELLEQGVAWAAGAGDTRCKAGREIAARPSARK